MDCQPTEKPLFHNEGRFFHGRRERRQPNYRGLTREVKPFFHARKPRRGGKGDGTAEAEGPPSQRGKGQGGSPEEGAYGKEGKGGSENSRGHEKGEIPTGWKGSQGGENVPAPGTGKDTAGSGRAGATDKIPRTGRTGTAPGGPPGAVTSRSST